MHAESGTSIWISRATKERLKVEAKRQGRFVQWLADDFISKALERVTREYHGVFEGPGALLPSAMFCSLDDAARYRQTRPNPTAIEKVSVGLGLRQNQLEPSAVGGAGVHGQPTNNQRRNAA